MFGLVSGVLLFIFFLTNAFNTLIFKVFLIFAVSYILHNLTKNIKMKEFSQFFFKIGGVIVILNLLFLEEIWKNKKVLIKIKMDNETIWIDYRKPFKFKNKLWMVHKFEKDGVWIYSNERDKVFSKVLKKKDNLIVYRYILWFGFFLIIIGLIGGKIKCLKF